MSGRSYYGYDLTPRARELLAYLASQPGCPTFEEMSAAMGGRVKSGIHRLITQLEERGYIRRLRYRARAIEILRRPEPGTFTPPLPPDVIDVPLRGRINLNEYPRR